MKINVQAITVDVFVHSLTSLSKVLEKGMAHAAAKKIDPSVLVNARLAPDMFPLSRQIQIATDNAKNGTARLAGLEPPRFEDNEKTFEELLARIARTIEYVKSVPASAFEGAEDRDLRIPAGKDKFIDFKGLAYIQTFLLPNFFFHVTIPYAILRHNGTDIGKRDFLGGN
jgi:hypothetical protein